MTHILRVAGQWDYCRVVASVLVTCITVRRNRDKKGDTDGRNGVMPKRIFPPSGNDDDDDDRRAK